MTTGSSQVVTTDVTNPSGLAWYYNEVDGTSRFYVGQYNSGNVKIFDESWTVIGTIPNFSQVTGMMISPVNTLWVADRITSKIDEFDLDGNFIRNVLSDLPAVWSMSYHPSHPSFVWIIYFDLAVTGVNAKRIKIY